jgi:hypothetical protein
VRVGLRGFSTIDIETQLDDTIPPVPFFTGVIEIETVSPSSLVNYE